MGEDYAQRYLSKNGFKLVKRNYRCKKGEIDLIVKKNNILVFVEVKTWDVLEAFDLSYVINYRKIKRIVNASMIFLRDYKGSYSSYEYDVLLLKVDKTVYEHYRNILME